jgi:hypothetical protein
LAAAAFEVAEEGQQVGTAVRPLEVTTGVRRLEAGTAVRRLRVTTAGNMREERMAAVITMEAPTSLEM